MTLEAAAAHAVNARAFGDEPRGPVETRPSRRLVRDVEATRASDARRAALGRHAADPVVARRLFHLALREVRSAALAEECVQEAYVLALEHVDQYREETAVSWLRTIVLNVCRMRRRRDRRARHGGGVAHVDVDDLAMLVRAPAWQAPDAIVEQRERWRRFDAAMLAERSEDRALLAAFVDRRGSAEQVAQMAGLTVAALKTRITRMRRRIRRRSEDDVVA
jgi:RNA polymerase sigma-70 factor (ECF subfamily)